MATGNGYRERDEGMDRALKAEHKRWVLAASTYLDRLILRGLPFDADDLTRVVGLPVHRNAVGSLFSLAARNGAIRRVGHTTSRDRVISHATDIWRWEPIPESGYVAAIRIMAHIAARKDDTNGP